MDPTDLINKIEEALTVRRAFGDPISQDGVLVVPAARVSGGGGAGRGDTEKTDKPEGTGGGFGLGVTPAGAFVIRDGRAHWRPAVNVNRIILGGQVVAVVALLTLRAYLKLRARQLARTPMR